MLSSFFEKRFGIPPSQSGRLIHFFLLAVTAMAISVFGYTVASALFLAKIGAGQIPLIYIMMGFLSLPVYGLFSQLIDRFSRPRLFRYLLVAVMVLSLLLRYLAGLQLPVVFYALYMFFFITWTLLIDITFPSLVFDYFTSLQLKRIAPLTAMGVSLGGMIGGSLALLLTNYFTAVDLLILPAVLCLVAIIQITILERAYHPLSDHAESGSGEGVISALKSFAPLVRRYPIIVFLSLSTLLFILLNCVAEFQVFVIYSEYFPDEQKLASFIGLLVAVQSLLQMIIILLLTSRFIEWLGVVRMNLLYPITTLLSFVALFLNFRLPAAIFANVNYDSFYQSLDKPVYNLNFNAVPYRFVGRVKTVTDGFFYAAGIIFAGVFLLLAKSVFEHPTITLIGVLLSALFLVVRYLMGRSYLTGLVTLLRSGSVELHTVKSGLRRLPAKYGDEIKSLLGGDSPEGQIVGLELVRRTESPIAFIDLVDKLLAGDDPRVRKAAVDLLCSGAHSALLDHARLLLESEVPLLRKSGLQAMLISGDTPPHDMLNGLMEDPDEQIRTLAAVAVVRSHVDQTIARKKAQELLRATIGEEALFDAIGLIEAVADPSMAGLLILLMENVTPELESKGLDALNHITLGSGENAEAAARAIAGIKSSHFRVRESGYRLLGHVGNSESNVRLVNGLMDSSAQVRMAAASALAEKGEESFSYVSPLLDSTDEHVVDAAVLSLGKVRSAAAEDLLFDYVTRRYEEVEDCLEWLTKLPHTERFLILRSCINDFNRRAVDGVLNILSALGYDRTLDAVRRVMISTDTRLKANAVEALASLDKRRFVEPILPILEAQADEGEDTGGVDEDDTYRDEVIDPIVDAALKSPDRWLRVGALVALASGQTEKVSKLLGDNDSLVAEVAQYLVNRASDPENTEDFFMSRLMFLRKAPMFENLTLDELLIIDTALRQDHFLEGETICAEGSPGNEFYIIYSGSVAILKGEGANLKKLATLGVGQYFGEMALFDQSPRSATVVAENDCELLALDHNQFRSLWFQRPTIMLEVCKELSKRLRVANEQIAAFQQAKAS
jgi:HEAT repeat protein